MIDCPDLLDRVAGEHPRPLLFATVSGAHLYGFPSPDSDFDLRGAHLASLDELLALDGPDETITSEGVRDGREIDLVTHDARKFFRLMLRRNGYVLEQLYSPLVVRSSPEHEELKEIGRGCITRHHVHHYLGFARKQWDLLNKESPARIKPLLYVYRVLLTGIHLMRTGEVEANLRALNDAFKLPYLPALIKAKTTGAERQIAKTFDMTMHEREYERLMGVLHAAGKVSDLPEEPSARQALNDLLLRLRRSPC